MKNIGSVIGTFEKEGCLSGCSGSTTEKKVDKRNIEKKLNEFLKENNIEVDENGNFQMYLVVDVDDKEYEVDTIYNNPNINEIYTEERAYEDLKEDFLGGSFIYTTNGYYNIGTLKNSVFAENQLSIKEKLLKIEDKMFLISVNKNSVIDTKKQVLIVNKYKIIEKVELEPTLSFKINSFSDSGSLIDICVYNTLTHKSENIKIFYKQPICIPTKSELRELINDYLDKDQKQVDLMNMVNGSIL
jgi:hypothetical protein